MCLPPPKKRTLFGSCYTTSMDITDDLVITIISAEQLRAKGHDLYEQDEQDFDLFAVTETPSGEIVLVEAIQERKS